jgi:hypothetical protein
MSVISIVRNRPGQIRVRVLDDLFAHRLDLARHEADRHNAVLFAASAAGCAHASFAASSRERE